MRDDEAFSARKRSYEDPQMEVEKNSGGQSKTN
jgi:hypothetical protein